MQKKTNGTASLIRDYLGPILILLVGWVVGFALLQQQVTALASQVAEYPSADYFEEKFLNIDEKLNDLKARLE